MNLHDISAIARQLSELRVTPGMKEEDAENSMKFLAPFNQCALGVVHFSGETPWERHPDGEELLHVLEGEVSVTVLEPGGPVRTNVTAGSIFVVPKGLWHRQCAASSARLFFATPTEGNENSWAADPLA